MISDRCRIILRLLAESGKAMGSEALTRELQILGIEVRPRMVRYDLERLDAAGLTVNLGRRGRQLTEDGLRELQAVTPLDRLSYVATRVEELAYRMRFNPSDRSGTVVINVTRLRAADWPRVRPVLSKVLAAGYGMGRNVLIGREGELVGGRVVPYGELALGTLCSITLNGILRGRGIPTFSRFGGLLEIRNHAPARFTQIVHYEGTTIDPVEIFVKGRMLRVREAVRTGNGLIGASFREVPAVAWPEAEALLRRLEPAGLGKFMAVGRPGRPLVGIPVTSGRVGLIVAAGLNPIGALEEEGIETESHAMSAVVDFHQLRPPDMIGDALLTSHRLQRRIARLLDATGKNAPSREAGIFD